MDHLLIDQDAVPTLVETKLASNPEIRRTVVGQLLEYAAHASLTWSVDNLRSSFNKSTSTRSMDPDEEIIGFLGSDTVEDVEMFWEHVGANLAAKRLRSLIVADSIPDPLQRVVEFLNSQMTDVEVLAVEIKQLRGPSNQTLVPRVIGRTAAHPTKRAPGPRQVHTRETFLATISHTGVRETATRLLDAAEQAGAIITWGSSGVSVRVRCPAYRLPVSVAWINPPQISGWMGLKNCTFGATFYNADLPSPVRKVLKRWVEQFSADDFSEKLSVVDMDVWSVTFEDAAENVGMLTNRLSQVVGDLLAL